ncbi:hypothethical protein, short-chain dehydrogenase/reductase SDR domain (plasmid) [Ralstonia solanacearum PSI07]|nr:hypothethical protein, short-chain dehydrogenase/reductase SDR domain [Ralstonia solanacearum PSI07]
MRQWKGFTEADVPAPSGKCFIVTGANTGLGFETARVPAARGARVLLACRDGCKAEEAMARISIEPVGPSSPYLDAAQKTCWAKRLQCGADGYYWTQPCG